TDSQITGADIRFDVNVGPGCILQRNTIKNSHIRFEEMTNGQLLNNVIQNTDVLFEVGNSGRISGNPIIDGSVVLIAYGATISDNTLQGVGIEILGGGGSIISDNVITDAPSAGILLETNNNGIQILRNTLRSNGQG